MKFEKPYPLCVCCVFTASPSFWRPFGRFSAQRSTRIPQYPIFTAPSFSLPFPVYACYAGYATACHELKRRVKFCGTAQNSAGNRAWVAFYPSEGEFGISRHRSHSCRPPVERNLALYSPRLDR